LGHVGKEDSRRVIQLRDASALTANERAADVAFGGFGDVEAGHEWKALEVAERANDETRMANDE
jgi:hypothetical protein